VVEREIGGVELVSVVPPQAFLEGVQVFPLPQASSWAVLQPLAQQAEGETGAEVVELAEVSVVLIVVVGVH